MNYLFVGTLIAIVILLVIVFYKSDRSRVRKCEQKQEKLFQQSPEYRCPAKCFDCLKPQTFNYLNSSSGIPKVAAGL